MDIGNMIKTKREEKGMTQQEVARLLYVSRQSVSRWENGSRCPDLITAKKLAVILGVSLDELVPSDGLADAVPPKERPSGRDSMLSAIFLACLSIWFLLLGMAGNTAIFAVLSFGFLLGAVVLFIGGRFRDSAPQPEP